MTDETVTFDKQGYNKADDYKVDRTHPPREYMWKPGQSGNPGGRPKDAIRELLKEKSNQEVADMLYGMAVKGNLNAIREYLDRREGKVTLPVANEGEVIVRVKYDDPIG